jgi:hypothetical protein
MIKRILFSALICASLFSCTTSGSSNSDSTGGGGSTTTAAMVTRVDGVVHDMPPQGGGNLADATGGVYGNTYFLLNGYKNITTGKVVIGNTIYTMKIAIPKSDLSIGQHNFTSTIAPGGYYADFDITGPVPAETVNTTSGYINVTSYNTTTKEMKGNFNFTTNNGVNLSATSHTLIGTFDYILN